jgi:hypothetical protein
VKVVVAETNTAWSGPWGVSFTANLTDADIKAMFAYLGTIPKISNRVPTPLPPSNRTR